LTLTADGVMGGIYWLASYPKSGNTWLRTFLQNLWADGDAPIDINDLRTGAIASARGWIDEVLGFDSADLTNDEIDRLRPAVYSWSRNDKEMSYHKIHDAYSFLVNGEPLVSREGTLGAVYLIRNPLDIVASIANHMNFTLDRAISFIGEEAASFASKPSRLHPQVHHRVLSWSAHVASWIDAAGLRCEIVRYEDMLGRPTETFGRIARFLEVPTDAARVEKAIRFSDFAELRRQEAEGGFTERPDHTASFFRRGEAGAWIDTLTPDQVARIVADHGPMMRRVGYLDSTGNPLERPACMRSA
jgi:aryl sulfotransferase